MNRFSYSPLVLAFIAIPQWVQSAEQNESSIERIIVKGTKQNHTLLESPQSITVLNQKMLEQAGIASLGDIADIVPNVSISQIGQVGGRYISIRGIESNPFVVNRAAIYVDGIPYRDPDNINIQGAQQVEVLRGPQSTLYGASADAGIIVIETKSPSSEPSVEGYVEVNQFDNGSVYDAGLYLSAELANGFVSSLNINSEKGDSYVKNIGSTTDSQGEINNLRLQSKSRYFIPNSDDQIDIHLTYSNLKAPGLYEQEFVPLDYAAYNQQYQSSFNGGLELGKFDIAQDAPKNTEQQEWGIGLSYRSYFNDLALTMSAAYRESEEQGYGNDLDLTATAMAAGGTSINSDFSYFETRLATQNTNSTYNWQAGLAYYQQSRDLVLYTLFGSSDSSQFSAAPMQSTSQQDLSAFGQFDLSLSSKLTLQAGVRFESSTADVAQQSGILDLGFLVLNYIDINKQTKSNVWLPKVALSYAQSADTHLYASASRGYLPGGYNLVAASGGDEIADEYGAYDAEKLWSYEAGIKSSQLGGDLFISSAVFYIDASTWQEISLLTADDGTVLSTVLINSNAAITSKGGEFEAIYKINEALSLTAGFGYQDAVYDKNDYSGEISFAGNKVKMIPKWDSVIATTYQWNDGWYVRGQWRSLGKTALTADNAIFRKSINLVDVSMGYKQDNWSVRLYIDNMTNKRYAAGQAYQNFMLGTDPLYYAPLAKPRTIGLKASFKL